MGTHVNGILGAFKGTVGAVVGSKWKKKSVMRSRSGPRTKKPSQAQLEQTAKFELASTFSKSFRDMLKLSFPGSEDKMSGYNAVMQHILTYAITGTYPSFAIDYPKVIISDGSLKNVRRYSITSNDGNVTFTWTDNTGEDGAFANDHAMLLVYCEELQSSISYSVSVLRSAGTVTVGAQSFTGKSVHTWLSFASADGSRVARSLYTGSLTVQ